MVKVRVSACDICGATPAVGYGVESGTRRARVDLCPEHSIELERILSDWEIRSEASTSDIRDTARYFEYFATMEEVEEDRRKYLEKQNKTPTQGA